MRVNTVRLRVAAVLLGSALFVAPASAITLGQVDTFEGTTTLGWNVGSNHPSPPVVVDTGGPGGDGDGYMLLTAVGGAGAGRII
jgi:hypothetical protein